MAPAVRRQAGAAAAGERGVAVSTSWAVLRRPATSNGLVTGHARALTLAQMARGRQIPAGPADGTPTSRSGQLRSPRQNRRACILPLWPARYHQASTRPATNPKADAPAHAM